MPVRLLLLRERLLTRLLPTALEEIRNNRYSRRNGISSSTRRDDKRSDDDRTRGDINVRTSRPPLCGPAKKLEKEGRSTS